MLGFLVGKGRGYEGSGSEHAGWLAAFELRMKGPAAALGRGGGKIWLGIKAGKDKESQGKGPSTGQMTEFPGLAAIPCGA